MTLMRDECYVFDTNTLVSAALMKRSVPRQALTMAVATGALLFTDRTLSELTMVLARPKFDRYFKDGERESFLVDLVQQAHVIVAPGTIVACRDPKDDMFLDLAVHGAAAAIVTGDADLLVLHPFRAIPILTPQQFLAR